MVGFGRGHPPGARSMHGHPASVIERIVQRATAGVSRRDIAAEFNMTRSAICGVLHRQGFRMIHAPKPPKLARIRMAKMYRTKSVCNVPSLVSVDNVPAGAGVSWCDLQSHHCRWPMLGDLWCGEAKTSDSYCHHHHALAYRRAA